MKKLLRLSLFGLLLLCSVVVNGAQLPKYIFLFIGDGMGFNHVEATQIYVEKLGTDTGERSLLFPTFPVRTQVCTRSASHLITCSSAAATALATGEKTTPSAPCLYDLFNQKGYTMFRGMDAYSRAVAKDKILLFPTDTVSKSLKYAIDRSGKDLSLPDLTKACLANFQETAKRGFFMMVEGGKIDWAAHAHDGGAVVKETIDFDQCIRLAYDFYKKHPNETLILVTADHETGGLGLGNSDMNLNIDLLQYQKCSQEVLTAAMREMKSGKVIPSWEGMKAFLKKNLGFWEQIKITPREELELLICYEESFLKKKSKDVVSLYAKDEPLAVAAIALLDKKASLGWTTKTHTGAPVPLYAIGKQAVLYSGRRDNTDMANVLRKLFLIK